MFFEGVAWAQAAGGAAPGGEQTLLTTIVPLAAIFAVFYFLLIRPQTKKAKEHSEMLNELKRNDEIITTGGIIGRITDLGDKVVTIELAPNVRVRMERSQIASLSPYGKTQTKKEKSE
jgi:preprotein translocase subunit YajC